MMSFGRSPKLIASLPDQLLRIERLALARVQFVQTNLNIGAKARQRIDALKKITAELFLSRFRQSCRLRDCQFECFDHVRLYHVQGRQPSYSSATSRSSSRTPQPEP